MDNNSLFLFLESKICSRILNNGLTFHPYMYKGAGFMQFENFHLSLNIRDIYTSGLYNKT